MTDWKQCYALLDISEVSDENFGELLEMLGEVEETDPSIRDVDAGARGKHASIEMDVDHDRQLEPLTYVYRLIEQVRLTLNLADTHTVVTDSMEHMFTWLNEGKLPSK